MAQLNPTIKDPATRMTKKIKPNINVNVPMSGASNVNSKMAGSMGGFTQPDLLKNTSHGSTSSNESICRKIRENFIHIDRFNRVVELDEKMMEIYQDSDSSDSDFE